MFAIPWVAAGLGAIAAGILGWQLLLAHEKLGALEISNKQLQLTIEEKQNALNERALTEQEIRSLSTDELRRRLH